MGLKLTRPSGHGILLAFALLCVAVTSAFIMVMAWRINDILARPDWCARALGAGKSVAEGKAPIAGLQGCINLLTIQLRSLATNSHIFAGVIAMCLLVLIVIVIAGGKLSFKGGSSGVEGSISGKDDPLPVEVTNPPTAPVPTAPVPTTVPPPSQPPPQVQWPAPAPEQPQWPVPPAAPPPE
jgi:hypothetical protein